MTLREMFIKFMDEYGQEQAEANTKKLFKRPFSNLVRNDIVSFLRQQLDQSIYMVEGSIGGKPMWTNVPWIAIYDTRITKSAQQGVYIVYLLNKDSKELYLTLNQGATTIVQGGTGNLKFTGMSDSISKKAKTTLEDNADSIRSKIGNVDELEIGEINTGKKAYDAGCIYFKKYTIDTIPDDDELCSDLLKFINIYQKYHDVCFAIEKSDDWWPSIEEYTPGFSREQWLDILNNPQIIGPVWGRVLAMFYTEKNGATCSQLAQKFYDEASSISGKITNLAKKIQSETGCKTYYDDEEKSDKYWPILFQGRKAMDDELGGFVWRLRSELYEALGESDILRYLQEESKMNVKDTISSIKQYIAWKGFTYSEHLIENFYLSLKSKPFVILAGTSGTGKTKLVSLFAKAIGAEYKLIPVRPDWSDSSDLFGHMDLNGNYVPGELLSFVKEADNNREKPYILCLDEMNLARVEYYLSDFLSIIETREFDGDELVSQPLLSKEKYGDDEKARAVYGELCFPSNLYIVGTVNMDETTFPFSKKVLDRANTIEFNHVDLIPEDNSFGEVLPQTLDNSFLKTKYLLLAQCSDVEYAKSISVKLQEINEILKEGNAHVGYRVRDEVVFYMLNNKDAGLLSEDEAFDNEIMQKILPRLQGSSTVIKEMLCNLFRVFAGDFDYQPQNNDVSQKMMNKLSGGNIKYPKSAEKIAFMVRRYEEDGFTSYWL